MPADPARPVTLRPTMPVGSVHVPSATQTVTHHFAAHASPPENSVSHAHSTKGWFGPLHGLEEEAPEEPEPPAAEDSQAPIATRTRRRIATAKLALWPDVLFDPAALVQQTPRGDLDEDDYAGRA